MSYLEDYINNINYLPGEVCRSLELIKLLDEKAKAVTEDFSSSYPDYFSSIKKDSSGFSENTDLLNSIRLKQQKALHLSEEKVSVSKQLLDMIDFHILKLKQDLDSYKREISVENGETEEKLSKKLKTDKLQFMDIDMGISMYIDNPDMQDGFDMQADDGKTYCYCGKGSFGEMIECEAPKVIET